MTEYYMLNKPMGYITARRDPRHKTVMDLFPEEVRTRLFPVGRLDKDTEGLLIVTNDGVLNHLLLSPENHIEKKYLFYAIGQIDSEKLSHLESGARVFPGKEYVTSPASVNIFGDAAFGDLIDILPSEYAAAAKKKPQKRVVFGEVIITEGKKHQVKRMIAYAGGKVVYLKRLSMGALELDESLGKGQYRALTDNEILFLKNRMESV